jgi:hypothetical protein
MTRGFAIGIALALGLSLFARVVGFDRDRAYYLTVLVVIASYYLLFAVMGESMHALIIEAAAMSAFTVAAVIGFKRNLWLVVVGLAAHGVLDLLHAHLVTNPGVPDWWPAFCLAFDVGAAVCLACLSLNAPSDSVKGLSS